VGLNSATVNAATMGKSGGYMKGVVTYSVTGDPTVTLMSMISSNTMLNKFNV